MRILVGEFPVSELESRVLFCISVTPNSGSQRTWICWPLYLLKAKKKQYTEPQLVDFAGTRGVIQNASHGFPVGAIRVKQVESDRVRKENELLSSSSALRHDQVDVVHKAAAGRLREIGIKKDRDVSKDDEEALHLQAPKKLRVDDDVGFFGALGNARLFEGEA